MVMRAQIVLTPPESKKLIAKAIASLKVVRKAFSKGIILVGTSTTCALILEELTGKRISRGYGCGIVIPRGTCIMREMLESIRTRGYAKVWVLEKGALHEDLPLNDVLERMDADDVFIKGANALDPFGNAGIFLGSPIGGTVGLVVGTVMAKGINTIIAVGLEKLIPTPIARAAAETGIKRMDYSMGMPVGPLPLNGMVVNEVKALQILSGVEAVPIGAGGLSGAEGAVTLVIKGSNEQVADSLETVNLMKGTRGPPIEAPECVDCRYPGCSLGAKAALKIGRK
jgi:hypothetical protein